MTSKHSFFTACEEKKAVHTRTMQRGMEMAASGWMSIHEAVEHNNVPSIIGLAIISFIIEPTTTQILESGREDFGNNFKALF